MDRKGSIVPFVLFGLVLALLAGFLGGRLYNTEKTPTGAVTGAPAGIIEPSETLFKEGEASRDIVDNVEPETPAERIIKEYGPGDVEVLRNRALELVKKSGCFKQEYQLDLSNDEKKYTDFYSTNKVVNLVYDFNEQFHGWIVFKLVRINRVVKIDSLKVDIDVAQDKVSCPEIALMYTDKEQ